MNAAALADCSPNSSLTASVIKNVLSALSKDGFLNHSTSDNEGSPSVPSAFHGVFTTQGKSKHMEDSYHVQEQLGSPGLGDTQGSLQDEQPHAEDASSLLTGCTEDLAFFSVFDGHGGDEVAQHCSERLHQHFTRLLFGDIAAAQAASGAEGDSCMQPAACCTPSKDCVQAGEASCSQPATPESPVLALCATPPRTALSLLDASCCEVSAQRPCRPSLVSAALRSSFHLTDQELAGTEEGEYVGATAVVAVVGREHIWVAHCGDSRAVMQRSGDAVALTSDHKPDRPDEADRIRAAGGRIVFNGGARRVNGMLAMTRSIGDHYLRPYVIAEPEVVCMERTPEDEVLIIATDGLWDVFACAEAANLASRCISRSLERGMSKHAACRVAASVLANTALERGSRDNITVIVIDVTMPPPGAGDGGEGAGNGEPVVASSVQEEAQVQTSTLAPGGEAEEDGQGEVPSVSSSSACASLLVRGSTSMGKYMLLKSQSRGEVSGGGAASGASGSSGGGALVGSSPRQVCSAADLTRLCHAADRSDDGAQPQGHRPRFADARSSILAAAADGRSASASGAPSGAAGCNSSSGLPSGPAVIACTGTSGSGTGIAQVLALNSTPVSPRNSAGCSPKAGLCDVVCSPSRLRQGASSDQACGASPTRMLQQSCSIKSMQADPPGTLEQAGNGVGPRSYSGMDAPAAAAAGAGAGAELQTHHHHPAPDFTAMAVRQAQAHSPKLGSIAAAAGAVLPLATGLVTPPLQTRDVMDSRRSFDGSDGEDQTEKEAARRLDPLATGSASHHGVTASHGMSLASGGIRPAHEAGSPSERALSCP